MNWEQQKIMHYLLFKNWFIAGKDRASETFAPGNIVSLQEVFNRLNAMMPAADEALVKAYVVATCFHSRTGRRWIRKKLGWSKYYRLRYNLLSISTLEKSTFFDKMNTVQ